MASPANSSDPHELLICTICEELYDDSSHQAKFLTCYHTFCLDCLKKLGKESGNSTIIHCPNCRVPTTVPQTGVEGLQSNFYIASLQEVSSTTEPQRSDFSLHGCHKHCVQPQSHFCVTCGISICHDCTTRDHQVKNGHSVIRITETEAAYVQELNSTTKSLHLNKNNLQLIESEISLLTASKDTAIKDMETFIKLAREQLEQRRNDLMKEILDHYNSQQNTLLKKQKEIQDAVEILNKNITQAKIIAKTGNINKLKPISESQKKMNDKTQLISSNLDLGENYMTFNSTKGLDEFHKCLCTVGDISSKGFLPSRISFRSTEVTAGHQAILGLDIYDHHGDKLPVSSGALSFQVTDPTDTKLQTDVCNEASECTLRFTPQISGLHQVSGMFLGQPLTSEQSHVSVGSNNPVFKFGKRGNGHGLFRCPWGIAIDNNNCLYIADTLNKMIQKFSADGKFLNQFSVAINNEDCTTCDVALDLNNGLICCTEFSIEGNKLIKGHDLLVFNLEGQLQKTIAMTETMKPFFLAKDKENNIIMCDIGKHCLVKVDKNGNFLCCIGEFKYPSCISINNNDDSIIVSDTHDHCIYIFSPDGRVRHKFGSFGTGKGQLKEPLGVATDGEYILVADRGNNRIQVFDGDGTFVSIIESNDDPLQDIVGLAVTKDGYVYVSETTNHCIKKYRYRDAP